MDIFISYRRDDSGIAARLLHQELAARWGADAVFMDVEDIGWGENFAAAIDARLAQADVVLVVLGPRWHDLINARLRGDDWVRHEVAQALALAAEGRLRLLPVQLDGTDWPGPPLPPDIDPLRGLSALKLRQRELVADLATIHEAVQGRTERQRADDLAAARRTGWRARLAAAAVAGLVFVAAWVALLDLFTVDTRLTAAVVSLVPPPAAEGTSPVVLVAIDAATLTAQGMAYGPAWRGLHGQLVRRAADAGARVVAFDLLMPAPGDAVADAALHQALAAVRGRLPVVLGHDDLADGRPAILPALAPLVHAGLACAGTRLGRAAMLPLAVQSPPATGAGAAARGPLRPSLALAAYLGDGELTGIDAVELRAALRLPPGTPPAVGPDRADFFSHETVRAPQPTCPALRPGDQVASQWIDPAALARGVPRVAYQDVLAGRPASLQALAGRTVLVGVLLPNADQFALQGGGRVVWGSELIAAQIDALHRGVAIRPLGALGQLLGIGGLSLAGAALALGLRQRAAWQRVLAWSVLGGALVVAGLAWYHIEGQVVPVHHGLLALGCSAGAALWLARRAARATGAVHPVAQARHRGAGA